MCSGVGRKLSTIGHAIGMVNLATASTRLKAVGLNERLLSGVLTPQSSELTAIQITNTHFPAARTGRKAAFSAGSQ